MRINVLRFTHKKMNIDVLNIIAMAELEAVNYFSDEQGIAIYRGVVYTFNGTTRYVIDAIHTHRLLSIMQLNEETIELMIRDYWDEDDNGINSIFMTRMHGNHRMSLSLLQAYARMMANAPDWCTRKNIANAFTTCMSD